MWKNAEDNDNSEKIQALSLAKECYSKQQQRLSSNNNKDCNESKEPELKMKNLIKKVKKSKKSQLKYQ
jgi:hypothetical protein